MFRLIYDILTGIFTSQSVDDSNINIDEEWIAILSECEQKIAEKRSKEVSDEIDSLGKRSTKLTYKDLVGDVRGYLSEYDTYQNSVLQIDLKESIFKDVFTELSPVWLKYLSEFSPEIYSCWYPTEYQKNILGDIIAIATQFSPNKLTSIGLSQTLMSIHLSLTNSLYYLRKDILTNEQSNGILKMLVSTTVSPLVDLWLSTVHKSQNCANKMGKLPLQWKNEEEERQMNYKFLKSCDAIDAKYLTVEVDPVRKKYLLERFGVESCTEEKDLIPTIILTDENSEPTIQFVETREKLEHALRFRFTPNKKSINENIISKSSAEFLANKTILETNLFFRK